MDLTARWDARLKVLLANLAHGERDHVAIARLSAQVELDYHGRFLVELLQNAVDQATATGLAGSVCRVWQRPGLLAVANQGLPFNAAGVEAVTSIALSDKRADEAIGNKGIGFKAVFEVTDDAWVVSCGPGSDLTYAPTTAIALSREVGAVSPALRGRVVAVLAERPDEERAIRDRFGRDPVDVVVDALEEQPGWRYPRAIDEEAWRECLRKLDVGPEALAGFSTMVVLPIRSGAEVLMATAVRGIADPEVLLFLDGIGRLEIDVDGELRTVERPPDTPLAPGIALRTLRSAAGETRWWVATVRSEDPAIHDAAAELPGPGWRDVHGADIRVALPVSGDSPPLVDGRFHIGLPTHDRTGSPFRVDARFYGTLARKSLDLGVRLNAILRDLAVVQAADLLRWLAVAGTGQLGDVDVRAARRSVAWGLQVGIGLGFGEAVRKAMAGEAVVLRAHDDVVVPAADLALSTEKDDAVVDWLTRAIGATVLHDYGVALPDSQLVRASRKLLLELGVPHQLVRRLTSRRGERSALEEGVRRTRTDREAWTVLVAWLKDRRLDEVGDQKIMPLVGDRWSTPAERPYLPLQAEPPPSEVGEAEVPTRLLSRIPILDASVLPAREALEEALVRAKEPKARAPLRVEVLVDALLPGLNEAIDAGQHAAARELLTLALRWSRDAGAGAWRANVHWRVPTTKGTWIDARTAYFSDGWRSEQERERVPLEEVFGARGHCLHAWWGEEPAKEEVRAALTGIGVAKEPRTVVVTGSLDGRRDEWSGQAPLGYPEEQWWAFVEHLAELAGEKGRRRTWELSQCSWIDGFEAPAGRALLGAWALLGQRPTCTMVSQKYSNRSPYLRFDPPQPWAQALRADDALCIPTDKQGPLGGRLARPKEIIRLGEHTDDLRRWVPSARPGISDAALEALGVLRVADASASWLFGRLRYVAEHMRSAPTSAERVARLLWAAINGKVAGGQRLPLELADWRVPVWKGGDLTQVAIGTAASLIIMDDPYQAEVHPEWGQRPLPGARWRQLEPVVSGSQVCAARRPDRARELRRPAVRRAVGHRHRHPMGRPGGAPSPPGPRGWCHRGPSSRAERRRRAQGCPGTSGRRARRVDGAAKWPPGRVLDRRPTPADPARGMFRRNPRA
jgi:hypothetical protein